MRTFSRTCALVAIAAGVAVGCSDPEFNTDLETEGPPEVTIVTVLSESLGEAPTFCIQGDHKVNTTICPETDPGQREFAPVMDALPGTDAGGPGWFVRFVFSELLDPDIERLEEVEVDENNDGITDKTIFIGHLDDSQPFELFCGGVPVAYDGFYDPSGNDVTIPPGPALVLQPLEFVASGRDDCKVTLNDAARDKDGNSVADSGLMGPHQFGTAVMDFSRSKPVPPATKGVPRTNPADKAMGVSPKFQVMGPMGVVQQGPKITFNAPVDVVSLADQIEFVDAGGNPVAYTAAVTGSVVQLTLAAPLAPMTSYEITVPKTNTIADIEGGRLSLADDFTFGFTTGM